MPRFSRRNRDQRLCRYSRSFRPSPSLIREALVTKCSHKLRRAREAVGGQLLQSLRKCVADVRWYGPSLTRNRRCVRSEDLDQHCLGGGCREGWLTGEHLVEYTAECIHIRAWVHVPVAGSLFRAHVVRCAKAESRLRDPSGPCLGHSQRDAEVGDERLSLFAQEDIGRFDVAVDDAVSMGVVKGAGDLLRDGQRIPDGELLLAVDALPERLPLDVGHDVEQEAVSLPRIEEG